MAANVDDELTATEARVRFGEMLDRVEKRSETILIARGGKQVAAVIPIEEYRRWRRPRLSEEFWERRKQISEEIRRNLNGRPWPTGAELVNEGRE